ncbi:exopolyphosphatase [Pasteurellaceae bacterium 22721_9_1]
MNNINLIRKATALSKVGTHNVREIAAIDLGSNSFHMIIARIVNGSIQILSRLKQKVQLAKGLDEHGVLDQDAINRGVNCLALFAERLQGFPAENVNVVGTYTLRSAVNNDAFLQQAKTVFPYPINIISGQTEAKMIYAGVSHTQPENGRKLVIDIGGGSTEMIIGEGFNPIIAESRDMGCVSFAKQFFPQGEISAQNFERARRTALSRIADLRETYRQSGWQYVLGSSGTIKTVYQVIMENIDPDGIITPGRLDFLIERTLKVTHFNQLKLSGLNEDRADVFVPGLAILSAVFDSYGIEQMRYSDGALREGVMYSLDQDFQVINIRQRTAESLAKQFNIDRLQAERVSQNVVQLTQQMKAWQEPHLADEMEEILLWAALLHEVGIVINHKNMPKHSAYILANMELPGFDKEQQRLLSALVRLQQNPFNIEDILQSARYHSQDILSLVRLLRLAILICRSRQATELPQNIHLNVTPQQWHLKFEQAYLDRNPLIKQDLSNEKKYLKDIGLGFEFA